MTMTDTSTRGAGLCVRRCVTRWLVLALLVVTMQPREVVRADDEPAIATTPTPAPAPETCTPLNKAITTNCGGACASDQLCLQVNQTCPYKCVPLMVNSSIGIVVRHGEYKSAQAKTITVDDTNNWIMMQQIDLESANETSNDDVSVIDVLNVSSSLTDFFLIGGSFSPPVRGYVINMTLSPGMLRNATNVKDITIVSVNVGETKPRLRDIFADEIEILSLQNCLLEEAPSELGEFTSLQDVSLNDNYLTAFPAGISLPKLTTLSVTNNDLKTFEASFPSLERLNLAQNALTRIPPAIFSLENLKSLDLRTNRISGQRLTPSQYEFLNSRSVMLDRDIGDTNCPETELKAITTNNSISVSFCVREAGESSSESNARRTRIIITVVVCVLLVVVVVGFARYRYGRQRRRLGSKGSALDTEFTAADTDPSMAGDGFGEQAIISMFSDRKKLFACRHDINALKDIKIIGSGAFGQVWLVSFEDSKLFASKRLLRATSEEQYEKFVAEIELNASLSHSRIVRFHGVAWRYGHDLQALFDYMENGDLRSWLTRDDVERSWTTQKLQIAIDIVEALVYVHSFKPPLVHRDLKSRNLLLSGKMEAKLCDFGIARFTSDHNTMTAAMGTSLWLAPEIILCRQDYDQFADIYSLGVVLSELDTHRVPYEDVVGPSGARMNAVTVVHAVGNGTLRPNFSDTCPRDLEQLAQQCLDFDPTKRPSANAVMHALSEMMARPKEDSIFRLSMASIVNL